MTMDKPVKPEPYKVKLTDLRSVTRESSKVNTRIYLMGEESVLWIVAGESSIRLPTRPGNKGEIRCKLDSVTDVEHDSANAFVIPLIGLSYEGTDHGISTFYGWIPSVRDRFDRILVPEPGYDPKLLAGVEKCKEKGCRGSGAHWIGDVYLPPTDPRLPAAVAGKPVRISIGTAYNEE